MQSNFRSWVKYISLVFTFLFSFFVLTGCSVNNASSIGNNLSNFLQSGSLDNNYVHSGILDVYTLDIGQGDAHLIKVGDEYTLIDTGDVDHRDLSLIHI